MTPLQLIGELADTSAPPEDIDPENHGFDEEEEEEEEEELNEVDQVQCDPIIECPLNDNQLLEFKERVPVLSLVNSYAVSINEHVNKQFEYDICMNSKY